jgi:general secretion pathway protein G
MKRIRFSLTEILLTVIILGIVASITLPQCSVASEQSKISSLIRDLQQVRWQIQLYKNEHHGKLPTANGLSFSQALTKYTYADGSIAKEQKPGKGVFGPYLDSIPENPFVVEKPVASQIKCGTQTPEADGSSGWFFNTLTGAFNANDSSSHSAL